MSDKFKPYKISLPIPNERLLLHCCCAPCLGFVIEILIFSEIDTTVFFYNPNIHPIQEYELRKKHIKQFVNKNNIPFIDLDYDPHKWFELTKGLEDEPEKGVRCNKCFEIRLGRSAFYAHENNFKIFSSTFGISAWKDMNQVNTCGVNAASNYPNLTYWTYDWRKHCGIQAMYEISKRERFYKQEYCGCIYSLMKNNLRRFNINKSPIIIGSNFYDYKTCKLDRNG